VREGREKWGGGGELGHERVDGPAERNGPTQEKKERERGGPRAERERGEGVKGFGVCLFVFFKPFPNLFKHKHFFLKKFFSKLFKSF
jgi:hypothetical protein